MEKKIDRWPLATVCGLKENINTKPDYQRPLVWKLTNKQLLIDTILRGYDIPKFYLKENKKDNYDVVDGQQRIRTMWDFQDNKFKMPKDSEPIEDNDIADKLYSELPVSMKKKFDMYLIDLVVLYNVENDEEIREMFLRLQNGITLKAQEKRHAFGGNMRDFVIEISKHPFFKKVGYKDLRFAHESTAAQLILLEINGEGTDVRNSNLNNLYKEHKDFDENSNVAKKIKKTISYLDRVFEEHTPELKPYYVQSMYMLISKLLDKFVIDNLEKSIFKFFLGFDKYRSIERKKEEDRDPDITEFQDKVSHSGDSKASLDWRLDFFFKIFGQKFPDILLKDDNRNFTYEQKLAIWRRDNQICQIKLKCNGVKLSFSDMEADHTIPHVKGGETTVSNGKTSCVACNRSKGAN